MRKKIIFIVLTVLSTMYIFRNSAQSAAVSSNESGRIINWILTFIPVEKGLLTVIVRKCAHIFEFFVQSCFLTLTLISFNKFPKNIIYILFTGLLTACTDELLQTFSPERGPLVTDVFIDFSGCIIAVLFVYIIFMFIKKRSRK